jgi:two-component system, cell cycle response regulator
MLRKEWLNDRNRHLTYRMKTPADDLYSTQAEVRGCMDASSQPFKILAVDDSAVSRKLVQHSLSGERYSVVFAKDGREALALFAEHDPAVVITDWDMPDIGGLELCKRIRREFQASYSHLILLSGNTDKEHIVEGLAAGADDYLTKPFHAGELVARVEVGCRIAELHRQIQAKNRLLEEMALTDSLTGLPNRRALDVWAPRQLSAAARHSFSVWVVMADLDLFKKVNDTFGHDAGDTVLKSFAKILAANTRQSNICARLGGEEFLLMISHADKKNAKIVAERIRQQFESKKFTFGNSTITVTASFGIAGFCGTKPLDLNALVCRADAALYAAKHNGRNRIEFEPAPREAGV